MNLSEMLIFRALSPSGGESGAPDTGCVVVAWHSSGSYEEVEGMYDLSAYRPTATDMNNVYLAMTDGENSYVMPCTHFDADGMTFVVNPLSAEGDAIAMILREEFEGMPAGFWFIPPEGITDAYLIWETA